MISSFFDTVLFFMIAFAFVLPLDVIVKLIIGDYAIKLVLAIMDSPLFYLAAIKFRQIANR